MTNMGSCDCLLLRQKSTLYTTFYSAWAKQSFFADVNISAMISYARQTLYAQQLCISKGMKQNVLMVILKYDFEPTGVMNSFM